jgi:hypothetical protein
MIYNLELEKQLLAALIKEPDSYSEISNFINSRDFFSTDSLGFRYNDPAFSIPWPAAPQHISGKDMEYPDLNLKTI